MIALVDGAPAETIPVTDSSVLRGDGCFESVRSYGGRLFALGPHLDRLARSAELLGLSIPARADLEKWCEAVAAEGREGVVRIVVTRGDAVPGFTGSPRCVVLHHPLPPALSAVGLMPVPAPWHPAGRDWELAGAKTLSYGPNLAAGRRAREAGYDDALLISDLEIVLEGPTFSIAWLRDGILFTPSLDLHVLASITRGVALDVARHAGIEVLEGEFPLSHALAADEALALSTVKEVLPVVRIGDVSYAPGPAAALLGSRLRDRVAQEIRPQGGVGR